MKSAIIKRSIVIDGHKTSVSLEDAFWSSLKNIARTEGVPVSKMVTEIDKTRQRGNLSCAIRLFVLEQVRTKPLARQSDRCRRVLDSAEQNDPGRVGHTLNHERGPVLLQTNRAMLPRGGKQLRSAVRNGVEIKENES